MRAGACGDPSALRRIGCRVALDSTRQRPGGLGRCTQVDVRRETILRKRAEKPSVEGAPRTQGPPPRGGGGADRHAENGGVPSRSGFNQ